LGMFRIREVVLGGLCRGSGGIDAHRGSGLKICLLAKVLKKKLWHL